MNADVAPSKRRSWKWKLLFVILGVAGLAVALLLVVEIYGWWQWKDALAQAREVDPVLTFEEIEQQRREELEGKKNAAKLFPALIDGSEKLKKLLQENKEFEKLCVIGIGERPPLGHRLPEDYPATFDKLIQKTQPIMETINNLKDYPIAVFPIESPDDSTILKYFSVLRAAINLKVEQALCLATQGKNKEAAEQIKVIFGMSKLLEKSPFLIGHLVAIAINSVAYDTLQNILGLQTLDQETLLQFEGQLNRINLQNQTYQAFRGERSITVYRKRNIFKKGWGLSTIFAHGWILADLAKSVEYYNRILRELKTRPINHQNIEKIKTEIRELNIYPLTQILFPRVLRAIVLIERTEGTLRSTRTALAAERYRMDKGVFPETLDELVPDYMDAILKDPFDGKPLRYKKKDDRVIIYSIGDDRSDDGGNVYVYPMPEDFKETDWGFVLLKPEYRNQPAVETQSASRPATQRVSGK